MERTPELQLYSSEADEIEAVASGLQHAPGVSFEEDEPVAEEDEVLTADAAQQRFAEFVRNFRTTAQVFPYREMLVDQYRRGEGTLTVDLSDLNQFDPALLHGLQTRPTEHLKQFESAAKDLLRQLVLEQQPSSLQQDEAQRTGEEGEQPSSGPGASSRELAVQVLVQSSQLAVEIRSLGADHVNQLLKVSGIVVSASRVKPKLTKAAMICRNCSHEKSVPCEGAFAQVPCPAKCDVGWRSNYKGDQVKCPPQPYVVMGDFCEFIDQQTLKLQELPEAVPTGDMPRSVLCVCDRQLVDLVAPGARISVIGISSLFESNAKERGRDKSARGPSLRTPYLKVVGIDFDLTEGGRGAVFGARFSPAQEERMIAIASRPDAYELVTRSIAPSISGDYTKDIKCAIACLLFSGSAKVLDDGAKLRGDINVLLLGDPSTAKSQFLKFTEKVAPIGVYTSGKGSSAAGLTASVVRGHNQEFYLEGGAMVLADGGVCAIDEFDKMRETDRVAIHEAMEQQTISIAKAGICTVLNSRTSVLAAANPVFGRYDDLKSAAENIDMMSTILSRFDMIFIVRDVRDEERDLAIAKHVIGVHISSGLQAAPGATSNAAMLQVAGANASATLASKKRRKADTNDAASSIKHDILDPPTLKRYVQYCRSKCRPRLNKETASILKAEYIAMRQQMKQQAEDVGGRKNQAIHITVRQLEAMIRISEAIAKMRLQEEVQPTDVQEALRLFKSSTMAAAQARAHGHNADLRFLSEDQRKTIQSAETFLKQRLPIGTDCTKLKLIEEGIALGHSDFSVRRALDIMIKRSELTEHDRGKKLRRAR